MTMTTRRVKGTFELIPVWLPVVMGIGGSLLSAGIAYGVTSYRISAGEIKVADHESRLRTVEQVATETRDDVKWIRRFIEGK